MNSNSLLICEQAKEFIRNFFKGYLEDRDFTQMVTKFHHNISWFGTGAHEICKNYQDALVLMEAEQNSWNGKFKIIEQWYESVPINNEYCLVYGELKIIEDGLNTFLMEMDSRFSMICCKDDGEIKLYHAHFSVPNEAQARGEFMHKSLISNYNLLLEEKLEERTRMLKEKTNELETLANHIYGGVQICNYDDDFTIVYASNGFTELVGYSAEEIKQQLNSKHVEIVFPADLEQLKAQIDQQMKTKGNFSVEYRIRRKDGQLIWVLDKGTAIPSVDGQVKVQCILTDITAQKKIEEDYRVTEKRYEIAMQLSQITMFEYNIISKELILFEKDANMYGVPCIIPNGVETFISTGIIEPESVSAYREMYEKICSGELFAQCSVNTKDASGVIHEFELHLTSVFDDSGKPIRAIGVRKNVTQMRQLQKENEFGKTLVLNKNFVCEADITSDKIIHSNAEWVDEIAASKNNSFSDMIIQFCENFVAPQHQMMVLQKMSKQNIAQAFYNGQKLVSFSYQIKGAADEYIWFEGTINIIKEQNSIFIRYYTADINEKKKQEQRTLEERRLYESMLARASIVYEVNITKNLFLSGHENWGKLFGIQQTNNYSEMMQALVEKAIHPEDVKTFNQTFLRENVLRAYEQGQTQLVGEYRRPNEEGNFIWVRCTFHLFKDQLSGNVKGHSYIENIHDEKQQQLELIYKSEHDPLTGLYNKAATEKHITDFLATSEGKLGIHAFFILDIDFFKSVNDNFGHAFGDAVLSQVAAKISDLFRDGDILGRIGGDEFVMLMKNIQKEKTAMLKANEVCDKVVDTFTQKGMAYQISSSIGLAFYNEHGKSYDELYKKSDRALYVSKENGRHQYTVYSDRIPAMGLGTNEIDGKEFTEIKTFEENVTEYVFRILYDSNDKATAIHSVLELVGKHYNVSHAYVFETTYDGDYAQNTFEWHSESFVPQLFNVKNIANIGKKPYEDKFSASGIFFMPDSRKADAEMKSILEPQGVKSMLQFSIIKNGEFKGFIGFDECEMFRVPTNKEIAELKKISNILGVFITEMRAIEESESIKNVAMSIVNGMDSYAFVCDPQTHKILFMNDKAMAVSPQAKIGLLCHEVLWGDSAPCEICPMKTMIVNKLPKYAMELYNPSLKMWIRSTASWIDWLSGKRKCLIENVDISQYKK